MRPARSSLPLSLSLLLSLSLAPRGVAPLARADDEAPPPAWGEPRKVCDLGVRELDESSGLAASRALDGVFWTHNDSGDAPRLFAVDREGRARAVFRLEGAQAQDWEDLCAFSHGGKRWLLVGDVGDNDAKREHAVLYLVEEPRSLPPAGSVDASLPVHARWVVTFEDGPHDCEGLAVDETTGAVLLVSKLHRMGKPAVYTFDLPALEREADPAGVRVVARKLGELDMPPLTTAMDVSPDGRLAVVLTYIDAYVFARGADEGWADAFARPPLRVAMPRRRQGESICFGPDGRGLWLTSEKLPTPLWEVPAR